MKKKLDDGETISIQIYSKSMKGYMHIEIFKHVLMKIILPAENSR